MERRQHIFSSPDLIRGLVRVTQRYKPPAQGRGRRLILNISSQRGAMFGLDARLAMVVFSAISVIAGYAGFTRVEAAKQARFVKELQHLESALTDFQTDMRVFFPFAVAQRDGTTDLAALWDKNKVQARYQRRWNGPYTLHESLENKQYGRWWLRYGQDDPYFTECDTQNPCYVWLYLSGVPENMWKAANRIIDEDYGKKPEQAGETIQSGKIRATDEGAYRTLIYRTVKREIR